MSETTGTGIGLRYGWSAEDDDWGESMNFNLLTLDKAVNALVRGIYNGELPFAIDPQPGDCYIVGDDAKGPWEGRENDIALFEEGSWTFFTPKVGWRVTMHPDWSPAPFWWFNGESWGPEGGAGGADPYDLVVTGGIVNVPQPIGGSSALILARQGEYLTLPHMPEMEGIIWYLMIKARHRAPAADQQLHNLTRVYYPMVSVGEWLTAYMMRTSNRVGLPVYGMYEAIVKTNKPPFGETQVTLTNNLTNSGITRSMVPGSEWSELTVRNALEPDYQGLYRPRWGVSQAAEHPETELGRRMDSYSNLGGTGGASWDTPEAGIVDTTGGIVIGAVLDEQGMVIVDPKPSSIFVRDIAHLEVHEIALFTDNEMIQFPEGKHSRRDAVGLHEKPAGGMGSCIGWWVSSDLVGDTIVSRVPGAPHITVHGNPDVSKIGLNAAYVVGPNASDGWEPYRNTLATRERGEWVFTPLVPDQVFVDAPRKRYIITERDEDAGGLYLREGATLRRPPVDGSPYSLVNAEYASYQYEPEGEATRGRYVVGGTFSTPPHPMPERYVELDGEEGYLQFDGPPDHEGEETPFAILVDYVLESYDSGGGEGELNEQRPVFASTAGNSQLRVGASSYPYGITLYTETISEAGYGGSNNGFQDTTALHQHRSLLGAFNSNSLVPHQDGEAGSSLPFGGPPPYLSYPVLFGAFKARSDEYVKRFMKGRISRIAMFSGREFSAEEGSAITSDKEGVITLPGLVGLWEMLPEYEQDGAIFNQVTEGYDLHLKGTAKLASAANHLSYIVGENATGDWEGHEGELAFRLGRGWSFLRVSDGIQVYDAVNGITYEAQSSLEGVRLIEQDTAKRFDITFSIVGEVAPSQVLGVASVPYKVVFEPGLSGSSASSTSAPAMTSTYEVWSHTHNLKVGDVIFSPGSNEATFSGNGYVSTPGDLLALYAPTTPDAAITAVSITIAGRKAL